MGDLPWQDVKELLADALEVEPVHRAAFVARACGQNMDLRHRLEELLEYENEQGIAVDEPADQEARCDHSTQTSGTMEFSGRRLGPYVLLEPLGDGGMGTVWKADQRYPVKRIVAIKLIKLGYDTEEVIARFQSERQALARMDHPGIAKVFDAGVDDRGRPYFAMEYVPGTPIIRFADQKKLSIHQRLRLFTQVCEAVAHAHTKAIIHRDLKSSNILAFVGDGEPVVKVIDFGIAKAVSGDPLTDHTFDTSRGRPIGTYESMSPEQAAGSPDIDTRTDVYSLGVLLYELLCGAKPFDRKMFPGASDQTIRSMICEVEPQRPGARLLSLGLEASGAAMARSLGVDALARQLRSELEWIPLMAMRKDPKRRYVSALDVCTDIRNYLNNRPLVAGPETQRYRIRKFVRRNRSALMTASIIAVITLFALVFHLRGIRLEQDEARKQQQIAVAVNKFLEDMLTSADPNQLLGDKVTVLQAIQAAVRELDAGTMNGQPLVDASLRQTIGNTLRRLSRYEEAEVNLRKALQLRRQVLPADDLGVAETLNDLGVLLRSKRKFTEAEQVHRDALKIRREKLAAGDLAIATSLTNLANTLQGEDRWEEAELFYRQALEIRRHALPAVDPLLAESLNNLGNILKIKKEISAAEPLILEGLKMRRRVLSPGHPDIGNSLQNLAALLRDQRKFAEAEERSRDALTIFQTRLPADHPDITKCRIALAKSLKEQGKVADAQPLLREAVESLNRLIAAGRQTVRTNGADLANNLHLLAQLRRAEGNFDEAEALLREALAATQAADPADPWNVLKGQTELGQLLQARGKLPEAEPLFRQVVRTSHTLLSPEDPALEKYLSLLITCLRQERNESEAQDLLREVAAINRKALAAKHPG